MKNFKTYKLLKQQAAQLKNQAIKDFFDQDNQRFNRFFLEAGKISIDFSKNLITDEVIKLLLALATEAGVPQMIQKMFSGEKINFTENRAVLHTALRGGSLLFQEEVEDSLGKMANFTEQIRSGKWLGYTGKPIKYLVHIGIGGSHLGPEMVVDALLSHANSDLKAFFVSNVDEENFKEIAKEIKGDQTLFFIASKSFNTQETLMNALLAKKWLMSQVNHNPAAVQRHFVALSTAKELAIQFGILEENIFPFREWVGGRFSLWSSIGLVINIILGNDNFRELLAGAREMDQHFLTTPLDKNLPVILALLGVWNLNFLDKQSLAVIPYSYKLRKFVDYLQQIDMESNGKRVNLEGERIDYVTSPVVWGGTGTDSQHSFHQGLMQGTNQMSVDFIFPILSDSESQQVLFAHCLAQSRALLVGRSVQEIENELKELSEAKREKLIPFKLIPGNVASNVLLMDDLTPRSLGALIALYEHKVFVQGIIWRINSFDQWGVELGKKIANEIMPLDQKTKLENSNLDSSTLGLIKKRERILNKCVT